MSKPKKKGGGKGRPQGKSRPAAKQAPKRTEAAGSGASAGGAGGAAPAKTAPKQTREERWAEARRARRRKQLLIRAAVGVVVLALVGGIVAWQVGKRRAESQAIATMTAGSCEFDRKTDPGAVNQHADNPAFKLEPPSGGIHTPAVANPGVYIDRQPPPDGQLVHALEHGDIALWYRPDLPEQDVATLRDLANKYPTDVLIVPRPQLPVPLAATAWHKRLLCDRLERVPLERFIERYSDKGPEGKTD